MLRVTIEVIPATGGSKHTVGVVDIGNVSGMSEVADYEYEARIDGETYRGEYKRHLRQHGAIRLAARVLGHVVIDLERGPSAPRTDSAKCESYIHDDGTVQTEAEFAAEYGLAPRTETPRSKP